MEDPNNENIEIADIVSSGIPRADSFPEIPDEHAQKLSKLQVSDGGFHTEAVVNDVGRIDIHIEQLSDHLVDQVVPTLQSHLKEVEALQHASNVLPPSMVGVKDGLPPPRMNIVIHVVGSRGDVQPFVSVGKVLREKYGHRVRLATHPTFKTFVEENGLEFFSIGGDPAELMAFMVKNPGLMPGLDSLKSGDVSQRRKGMYEIVKGTWRSCIEAGNGMDPVDYSKIHGEANPNKPFVADAIIANPPSFGHIHCAEKLGIPLHLMFTMPWSPTTLFPHPLTTIHSSNAEPNMTNLVSYALVEMMTWQGLGDVINRFRTKILTLEPVSLMWAPGMASRLRIPFTYCWSPALIPKPEDWGGHIFVSGFYFLSLASSYVPDPKLVEFLEAGPPPVYIGFGSIVVEDPDAMTRLIFDAVKKAGIRALVSKGWGGFGGDDSNIPENIFMLGNVPHDYLFKHVSAVVHHGGAGTTAAGILAGRPTVVVPFFGDQPFWGAMTARAGAGPNPIPFKTLTSDLLAGAILHALAPEVLEKAKKLGESIAREDGAREGAESFHNMMDLDRQRCLLAPGRVAVARLRKTNIRLSPLAVIVLGDAGLIKQSQLRLYRPCEWDVEEGPWDPLTGGASALLGTLSSLMVGIADIPVEIITGLKLSVQRSASERAKCGSTSSLASIITNPPAKVLSDGAPTENSNKVESAISPAELAGSEQPKHENLETDGELEPSIASINGRSHTVTIDGMMAQRHVHHRIDPGNDCAHNIAVTAEKGASKVASAVLRPAMDISLAIARGFHNAPKLYGDDTVREPEKIVNFQSGIAAAGREFAYGWFDGITGLVTQPLQGAKKHGVKGFFEGIGKGVGGFILKPGSAIFGLGGYTFKGIYRELQNHMGSTTFTYIIAARITQGHEDWENSTPAERQSIIDNWHRIKDDPKLQKYGDHHSHLDLLHHNDSESSLESKSSATSEKTHHHKRHSLLKHFPNHSHPKLETDETDSAESDAPHEHKHSLRSHSPHLHKRENKVSREAMTPRSVVEANVMEVHKVIPVVHEAEVREILS